MVEMKVISYYKAWNEINFFKRKVGRKEKAGLRLKNKFAFFEGLLSSQIKHLFISTASKKRGQAIKTRPLVLYIITV